MGFWQILWLVIMAADFGIDLCEWAQGQKKNIWSTIFGDILTLIILYKGGFF